MVNVDLLIRNDRREILLTWRHDELYHGWHVPGGVMRYKERLADRVAAVAHIELGTAVTIKGGAAGRHRDHPAGAARRAATSSRSCSTARWQRPPDETLQIPRRAAEARRVGMARRLPAGMISSHEMYRRFFEPRRHDAPEQPADDFDHILGHTEELWKELRSERLFITGGTGFFGRWLLESLIRANERFGPATSAVVLTRDAAAFRRDMPSLATNPAIAFHEGDLARFTFPDGEFSHVLHMGTTTSLATFHNEAPLAKFENIVIGTQRTLDFAVKCRARKFLLTSSGAVYGRQPADVTHLAEDHASRPDPTHTASAVGHSKRAAEFLTAAYGEQHGFDATIARCFSFVGRHLPLDIHYAIGNFMRDALKGGPVEVRGDGTQHPLVSVRGRSRDLAVDDSSARGAGPGVQRRDPKRT